jgi:hypothetical protein
MELPIGSIIAFAGPAVGRDFEISTGWMLCDDAEKRHESSTDSRDLL